MLLLSVKPGYSLIGILHSITLVIVDVTALSETRQQSDWNIALYHLSVCYMYRLEKVSKKRDEVTIYVKKYVET